jgi:hypothetical protein
VKALRYGPGGELRRLCSELERTPAYTLAGHFKAKPYGRVFGPGRLMTVLRDPVERVVSNYRHYLRRGLFDSSLVDFARQTEIRNVQVRFTRPHPPSQWLFVARQDRLDQDMAELSLMLGVDITIERVNAAPDGRAEISVAERRQIEALNLEDVELFERCRSLRCEPAGLSEDRFVSAT